MNKTSPGFVSNTGGEEDRVGSKWSLAALKQEWREQGLNSSAIFAKIKSLIVKTLISVEPHIYNKVRRSNARRTTCFELFGFDVLVDEYMEPWLLEVNVSPSLSAPSPLDRKIKGLLLTDLYNLVGVATAPFTAGPRPENPQERNDALVVVEAEEENYRRGRFKKLFPVQQTLGQYTGLFEFQRHNNSLLWTHVTGRNAGLKRYFKRVKHPINV